MAVVRRILSSVVLGTVAVAGGCASNPWPEAYTPVATVAPVDRSELLLVDFDEAVREREEPGHEVVGYASFTGPYSRSVERELRAFAQERGATMVAWGARHMHNELSTHLQPVFETYSSRRRGRYYDPYEGRYIRDDTTVTRYVPVVDEDAVYAFRAVFYRPVAP